MSEQPPYLRVADRLRRHITDGTWQPGHRLPSRAQLATDYQVGDNVVRRAQELLIAQGLLEGRAGSGTYVAQPRPRLRMVRTQHREKRGGSPFRADMRALGRTGTWESHTEAKVPAPDHIARRLGIATGDLTVCTRYEFLADDRQPVQLSTSWEPYDLTGGTIIVLPEGGPLAGRGVVERMTEIGVRVVRAVEVLEPGRATVEQAHLLGVPTGALVTLLERTYYDTEGRAVETADLVIPASRCEIVYNIPID